MKYLAALGLGFAVYLLTLCIIASETTGDVITDSAAAGAGFFLLYAVITAFALYDQ